MQILNRSLELAVEFHKPFAHLQGFQDPKKVVDTAKVFMAYLQLSEDNSVSESKDKKNYRNPSGRDNS